MDEKILNQKHFYIIPIIGKYFIEPKYTKFKDFVKPNSISNAIPFLKKNMDKIDWELLS